MPNRKRHLTWLLLAAGLLSAPRIGDAQPPSQPPVIATSTRVIPAPMPAAVSPVVPPPAPSVPVPDSPPPPPAPSAAAVQRTAFHPEAPPPHEAAADLQIASSAPAAGPIQGAALAVQVLGPAQSSAGETLPYEIMVRNPGPVPLTGVRIEEQLPAGAGLRSADPVPEVQDGRLVWNLGTLEGNGQRRIRIEIQPGTLTKMTLTPTASFISAGPRTQIVQPQVVQKREVEAPAEPMGSVQPPSVPAVQPPTVPAVQPPSPPTVQPEPVPAVQPPSSPAVQPPPVPPVQPPSSPAAQQEPRPIEPAHDAPVPFTVLQIAPAQRSAAPRSPYRSRWSTTPTTR